MTSQYTDSSTIAKEKAIVMQHVNLSSADEVVFVDTGWDSRIYSIDDGKYIFKFPRSEKVQGRYASQIEALKLIAAAQEDILIPLVRWTDKGNRYFGYEGIRGSLLRNITSALDSETRQDIGTKLGEFLKVLHSLKLVGVRDLSPLEEIKQNQSWYEKGLENSRKFFSPDELLTLANLVYKEWPAQLTKLGDKPTLCHGDFHFDNILYTDNKEVGVIDFGDICTADHSRDFADFEDETIFEYAIKSYASDDAYLLQKIKIREDMFKVITLTAQLAKQDTEKAHATAAQIRKFLGEA